MVSVGELIDQEADFLGTVVIRKLEGIPAQWFVRELTEDGAFYIQARRDSDLSRAIVYLDDRPTRRRYGGLHY